MKCLSFGGMCNLSNQQTEWMAFSCWIILGARSYSINWLYQSSTSHTAADKRVEKKSSQRKRRRRGDDCESRLVITRVALDDRLDETREPFVEIRSTG